MSVVADRTSVPSAFASARTRLIFGTLLLVLFLAALDQTIVATALPTVAADFGGIDNVSWVVTTYMLGTAIAGPICGKLGDIYGRKTVLQVAIVVFLAGSALCGLSQSMVELIASRGVQGAGAGGLIVVTLAVVGDIVPPRERGRSQSYFGMMFAVATITGPLVGGFIVEHLSWRWIFYVNVPFGLAAFTIIQLVFQARRPTERRSLDMVGAMLIATTISSIILVTTLGGTTYPWASPQILGLGLLGVTCFAGFILTERRVAEPLLPLSLFANRTFSVTNTIGFTLAIGFFGAATFLPLYLQVVRGLSPSHSGFELLPMMAGSIIGSVGAGRAFSRFGRYRPFPIIGTVLVTTALAIFSQLTVGTPTTVTTAAMVILGVGFGGTMPALLLASQNAVEHRNLGVATSSYGLFRNLGGALGIALLGTIFASRLATTLHHALPGRADALTGTDPTQVNLLPPAIRDAYGQAIVESLGPVFLASAVFAAIGFVVALLLKELPLRRSLRAEAEPSSPAPLSTA